MTKKFIAVVVAIVSLTACDNGNGGSQYVCDVPAETMGYNEEDVYAEDGRAGYKTVSQKTGSGSSGLKLTGIMEVCNHCKGYGSVQRDLYSTPHTCSFCMVSMLMRMDQGIPFDGRFGKVDAVFNTLPADYFDYLESAFNGGGFAGQNAGSNPDQIADEIAWHENNIASLERQLEYIDGSINRSYIQQQIIEERYAIRRLQNQM
jgi:hypothetical protein